MPRKSPKPHLRRVTKSVFRGKRGGRFIVLRGKKVWLRKGEKTQQ